MRERRASPVTVRECGRDIKPRRLTQTTCKRFGFFACSLNFDFFAEDFK